ncbi:MAG: response regulator [Desulfatirhabdiaceae bacterium]
MEKQIICREYFHCQSNECQKSCLMTNLPGMVYRCKNNAEWTMLVVSDGCKHLTGYEPSELKNDAIIAFADLIHPEDRQVVWDSVQAAIGEKKPYQFEYRIIDKDNRVKWVWGQGVGVYSDNDELLALEGYIMDITDKKQSETERQKHELQLQQADKTEAIGTLAGGIAHDFNNLLMGILGNVTLSLMSIDDRHPLFERLKNIENHVQSGADLTRQLLGFARGVKMEVKTTNLNELLQNGLEIFGRTKKELSISSSFQPDLRAVDVDRGQINQAMLNLYVNAWQAMPNGGKLFIQTADMTIDSSNSKINHMNTGDYVKISVTDTGVGMDAHTCERVFDPFFTTREKGRGTGLGLASVYGIVKNHNGFINVYSERGHGTTFTIYLPASEKMAMPEKKLNNARLTTSGTILLVDDESLILDVAKLMLERLGFHVISASNGRDAIDVYRRQKEQIDLIVLDMIMPGMGGDEVFNQLIDIDPNVRVLLASGYSLNGHASEIMKRGCGGFIQKPFSLEELTRKIRDVLTNE